MTTRQSAESRQCKDCMHFDAADGMCCRKFVVADALVHRHPPMREPLWAGEDRCGAEGRWFEEASSQRIIGLKN